MSKLDYKTIGRKAGVLRKQFEAFRNMVDMEERLHDTLGKAQDKLIAEGMSQLASMSVHHVHNSQSSVASSCREGTRRHV